MSICSVPGIKMQGYFYLSLMRILKYDMINVDKKSYKPNLPDAFYENKKKSEKNNNIYHILQTKLKINKDNENIYEAKKN